VGIEPNFFIKYNGKSDSDGSPIDLAVLGESIVGFNNVIKEIFKISKLKGDISISASKIREGSIIVDVIIFVSQHADEIPFDKVIDFLDFLRVISQDSYAEAVNFFNGIQEVHENINEFAKEYPATYDLIKTGITLFIGILIGKAQKHKKQPDLDDLPEKYAMALHKMISSKKFTKALNPLIEDEAVSIEVSSEKSFVQKTKIDLDNFENYLGEGEQILPDLKSGETNRLTGKVVGLQCSRGDSMKIKVHIKGKRYLTLVAFPPKGKTTQDIDELYGNNVIIEADIERKSLYQKPKLHIIQIDIQQNTLF
jgi:hypothetical protein